MNPAEHVVARGTDVKVRPLVEADLPAADRIFRQAFGTFLGLPDPSATFGDTDYVRTRWLADPAASLGAELDGDLVASNFVTNWSSIGVFGPLTVRPDLWDRGIAKRLMDATVDILDEWGVRLGGLFTFAHSAKHIGLYHRYGFWPQHLTFVMARPTSPTGATSPWTALSATPPAERPAMVAACREVADMIYQDLDVSREVEQVDQQNLGDTVLVGDDAGLVAFGVCHIGAGSEAGSGACYVKFGAVRPGPGAGRGFERLLDVRGAGRATGRKGPDRRRQHGPRRGLGSHDPTRLPERARRGSHASPERPRLQRPRPIRHRRLALTRLVSWARTCRRSRLRRRPGVRTG